MPKNILYLALICVAIQVFTSCKGPEEVTPEIEPVTGIVTPLTYSYSDSEGNNTVSFNGQAQRLEMLAEMTSLMKTANTSGVTVNGTELIDMYANNGISWADSPALGMTGSTKQLKNKTAAAPSGIADPGVQAYFENYMSQLAEISATTITGSDNGSNGTAGVVVSTTDDSKQYLFNANGYEYTQLIEKGLMGAVFYNQISQNYLGDAEMNSDNTTAVDPEAGKYYTEMEHAWDEAYGYFTTEIAYEADGPGTDRFWGKYANGRESILGSATTIATAFRTGRAAIVAQDYTIRDAQIAVIRTELEKVVAGTAIHYINGAISDISDDALRNHQLSEAVAFISCLPYGHNAIANQNDVMLWFVTIGENLYEVSVDDLISVRNEIAALAGLTEFQDAL